jgi:hypothetical protein
MKINWTVDHPEANYSTKTGTDEAGNRFRMTANGEVVTVTTPDGREGQGWTAEQALANATRPQVLALRPTTDDLHIINRILAEHDRPGLNLRPANAIRIALAEWEKNHMAEKYLTVTLTDEEMTVLDDGQAWYDDGDTVILGGYWYGGVDLIVNGETVCDNWTTWDELPESIRNRAK